MLVTELDIMETFQKVWFGFCMTIVFHTSPFISWLLVIYPPQISKSTLYDDNTSKATEDNKKYGYLHAYVLYMVIALLIFSKADQPGKLSKLLSVRNLSLLPNAASNLSDSDWVMFLQRCEKLCKIITCKFSTLLLKNLQRYYGNGM